MVHQSNRRRREEKHRRFRVRQLIRSIIDQSCFWDEDKREHVNRITRTDLLDALPVERIDVGQVPRLLQGEVLQDSRGEGSLQKGVFWR